nr:MAG TPA: hypothetical protein [Caudoviricetes sp.]
MENMLISGMFVELIVIIVMIMYINYLRSLIKDRERVEREVETVLKERRRETIVEHRR